MNLLDEASIVPGFEMPRLGAAQRCRLQQLSQRVAETVVWDGVGALPRPDALVVVLEPANAAHVEALVRSLDRGSIVALPFGENPVFDPIKSKLVAHGLIGAEGAEAPHQLWWGSVEPLRPRTGIYRRDGALFVSCYARGSIPEPTLARFCAHLELLGLDSVVEEIATDAGSMMRGTDKIDFITRQLNVSMRPVFWIDPAAIVRQLPLLPQSLGCDVAFCHRGRGEIETRALFFRPTATTNALLEVWHRLSMAYPDLPEHFLFDQAWILTCAQRSIETAWLPGSYAECDPVIRGATIELETMARARNSRQPFDLDPAIDRRFGRAQTPEPHLIMPGTDWRHRPIMVVIRDVQAASARDVGALVECIASAFEADAGGFCRLEIMLCTSDDEVASVVRLDGEGWVVLAGADEWFAPDAFAALGRAAEAIGPGSPEHDGSMVADVKNSVVSFAPPEIQAPARREVTHPGALLRRPMGS
uniref:Uncharacterized protein n=1 Tax=Rhodopseudomonas palustris (strain BisA53) TaxID=316055 RepID=Q07TJ3_RHOP5